MDQDSYLMFLPGRGICTVPDGKVIVPVYRAQDARTVLEHFSKHLRSGRHSTKSPSFTEDLLHSYGEHPPEISTDIPDASFSQLSFENISSEDTRIFVNKHDLNWDEIEKYLAKEGFALQKREYLSNTLDGVCHVFMLTHPESGVIAEGKGISETQAQHSALAEGVERVLSSGAHSSEGSVISTYDDLYKDKNWNFDFDEGPRDGYAKDVISEWVPAFNVVRNESCFVPKELVYFHYVPKTKLRLFSLSHTMGLAAGSSTEEAFVSGLLEVLERDAYWIIMRNKITCPTIDLNKVSNLSENVSQIIERLKEKGISVVLKDASLDWGVAIVHAMLVDEEGKIPAFAHGIGSGFDWSVAITRALTEAVQMHAGMSALTQDNNRWQEVIQVQGVLGTPTLAWSDPLFYPNVEHLIKESSEKFVSNIACNDINSLLQHITKKGHEVVVASLGNVERLEVVRVLVSGATQPDERLERVGQRMLNYRDTDNDAKSFYIDPILT